MLTWSDQHNIRIAREICGYEVQTSPRGVHYVVEDGKTRPLPDFPNDPGETLTTLEAWLHLRVDRELTINQSGEPSEYSVTLMDFVGGWFEGCAPRLEAAIANALYQTLPPEAPQ